MDLIGSFLYDGICFNPNYSHTDHCNLDISVNIPSPQCITLEDLTNGHYLLKRRAYLSVLYKHLRKRPLFMLNAEQTKATIGYLNHDASKPIIIIKASKNCSIRIIPALDIRQMVKSQDDTDTDT